MVCCGKVYSQGADKKLVSGAVFLALVLPANINTLLFSFLFFSSPQLHRGALKTPQMHTGLRGTYSSLA